MERVYSYNPGARMGRFVGGDTDCSYAHFVAPVVATTSIILSFNKIQNGNILVPANPGPPGKWPLIQRERGEVHSNRVSRTSCYTILEMLEVAVVTTELLVCKAPGKTPPPTVSFYRPITQCYTTNNVKLMKVCKTYCNKSHSCRHITANAVKITSHADKPSRTTYLRQQWWL